MQLQKVKFKSDQIKMKQVSKIYKGKSAPAPWQPCFLMDQYNLYKSLKDHLCKVIFKSVQWLLTRRFLKFSLCIHKKSGPVPLRPCFLMDQYNLNNLGRGSPMDHFCQIIFKSAQQFLTRFFFPFGCHGNLNSPWNGNL